VLLRDDLSPDEWAAHFERLRLERVARFDRAVLDRDLTAAVGAMYDNPGPEIWAPFVWPETYGGKTIYCQRPSKKWFGSLGFDSAVAPVLMRGAKEVIYYTHTKPGWAIKVFERAIRRFAITVVDQPLSEIFNAVWDRLAERHVIDCRYYPLEYRNKLRDYVVVSGKMVPMSRDRINVLEKGLRVIEKIEAMAA
jgi:hypothetical protein